MATKKSRKKRRRFERDDRTAKTDAGGRDFSNEQGQFANWKDAAALLDEEMAAGILAAKLTAQRFKKDKHIPIPLTSQGGAAEIRGTLTRW